MKRGVNTSLKGSIGFFIGLLLFTSCSPEKKKEVEASKPETEPLVTMVKIKKTEVFTTAHKTDLKLSEIGALTFNEFKQPLEYGITMSSKMAKIEIPAHGIQTIVMSEE
ncbi:MAG: hypothetical protein ABJJ25_04820 [Eudoraea sp.]|uniref:hypothetical protein n=1 Tax=Eudoraea sp. TaxID=1979955 RepID=UPI003266E6A6